MLPKGLIVQYRMDVRDELTRLHGLTPADADSAIRAWRALTGSTGIGDLAYHRDAEAVAVTVSDGWKSCFLKRPTVARTP